MTETAYAIHTWQDDADAGRSPSSVQPTREDAVKRIHELWDRWLEHPEGWGRSSGSSVPAWTIREVALPAVRLCAICNREVVTSKDPETDFCRACYYSGSANERSLEDLLVRLRDLPVMAQVWQTGGGCMVLAIWREQNSDGEPMGPFITAVEAFPVTDLEGTVLEPVRWEHGEPSLPEDPNGPWGADVWPSYAHWSDDVEDWDWMPVTTLDAPADADALVRFVRDNMIGEDA